MSSVRKRCPNLIVLPMRTGYYRAVSKDIRKRLIDCDLGVVEQASIDDFYVDITDITLATERDAATGGRHHDSLERTYTDIGLLYGQNAFREVDKPEP